MSEQRQEAPETPQPEPSPAPEEAPAVAAEAPAVAPTPPPRPTKGHRLRIGALLLAGAVGLLALFMVAVWALDFTESTTFCSSCHIMKPEVVAHDNSPHARTDCGTCHVGPGVVAAFKAKLENARYLWVYPLSLYEKPIPSPITGLRPVEVVCEQCHWPQKFYSDRMVIKSQYASDETNSLTRTQLLLRTGGGTQAAGLGRGIHWHIENPVYYIATDDKRQDIAWVQAEFQGVTTEYVSAGSTITAEYIDKAEKRKMDCVDCHNRATHIFTNPDDALDTAIANGLIASDLPFIKREGTAALNKSYGTEEEAATAISAIADFYRTNYPDVFAKREADVRAAVAVLHGIFDRSAFPFMNVTWESHPNNIGHMDFAGCFRCHDGKHLSADNQAIRLECNTCHSIPQVASAGKDLQPVSLTVRKLPTTHQSTTWLAEHRYKFDASCARCHTVTNPGGSDNSSFCSNSACHGIRWTYAGLDAPELRALVAPTRTSAANGPPVIPHPIAAGTNCLLCHAADRVIPFPANHASFKIDLCTQCHNSAAVDSTAPAASPTRAAQATAAPAATPAAVPTRTPSPATTPAAATSPATTRVASAAPGIPHTLEGRGDCLQCHDLGKLKPFPDNHKGRAVDRCQNCHKPKT